MGPPPPLATTAALVTSAAQPSFVIGANTFDAVQQQLSALRSQVYGSNLPVTNPIVSAPGMNSVYLSSMSISLSNMFIDKHS